MPTAVHLVTVPCLWMIHVCFYGMWVLVMFWLRFSMIPEKHSNFFSVINVRVCSSALVALAATVYADTSVTWKPKWISTGLSSGHFFRTVGYRDAFSLVSAASLSDTGACGTVWSGGGLLRIFLSEPGWCWDLQHQTLQFQGWSVVRGLLPGPTGEHCSFKELHTDRTKFETVKCRKGVAWVPL